MRRLILSGLTLLILCTKAMALTISPLVIEMNTDHRLTSQLIVTNNSTQKLALEANVHQLSFGADGAIHTSENPDKNVLVFPPAVLLEPGQQQAFRVQWISQAPLKTSQSYFVRFSTANLKQDSGQVEFLPKRFSTGINVKLHYNALLHVYSSAQKPDVSVIVGDQGNLTLTNAGDRFTFTTALFFKNLDHNTVDALYEALGAQFIPPKSTLTFHAAEQALPVGTYYGYEH
ncbi:fimbria/pilus periplasmic chaperone [Marinomonas ostreistagni]|uniref:fimbria/pilus periplasmic chaperone n=1 Tax=Marinomonas ostreistagni TaxID=359209 RepID=UPI00194F574F|nr:fimbria/pilus periplasmic chaperone [Marinomonas ostreistagni]MBM6549903.1 molecular chaperone [Marinomonas ostreistagni]